MSKEEIKKARSNVLRGNDIESACLIMEEVIWNNLVITGGRVNITKVAMRQILNFIEEYKNKGYLDIVREKVQLKERNKKLEQENKKLNKMINEMASYISNLDVDEDICKKVKNSLCDNLTSVPVNYCIECIKQYFEKKVEEK